jgi:nitrogen fixation NifU-like protein
MAYSEKVIEHYEKPRNVGSLDKNDPNVGTGLVGAPACGDVMKLQLKISDDGIIEDAKFKTFGCGSAIASSSLVTEWVKGKNITEAGAIKNSQIAEELSLPPVKIHCSVLAEDAIKAAIFDFRFKKGQLSDDEVLASVPAVVLEHDGESMTDAALDEEARLEKLYSYKRAHGGADAALTKRLADARLAADGVRRKLGVPFPENRVEVSAEVNA